MAKAYILPRLEYGAVFCVGSNANLLDRFQTLLNRALRICFRANLTHNLHELHVRAKLLPLRIRHKLAIIKLMLKKTYTIRVRLLGLKDVPDKYYTLSLP